MGPLEEQAIEILAQYPIIDEMPASISGKYHMGESVLQHVDTTSNIVRHFCLEFGISKEDTDMLVAAALLHDIGNVQITSTHPKKGYVYYKETGYSRDMPGYRKHGSLGAELLLTKHKDEIGRVEEIAEIVASHMSHWHKNEPQPVSEYQKIIAMADYISSKGEDIFNAPR